MPLVLRSATTCLGFRYERDEMVALEAARLPFASDCFHGDPTTIYTPQPLAHHTLHYHQPYVSDATLLTLISSN